MADTKTMTIRAMLRFGIDPQGAADVKRKLETLGNEFTDLEKQAKEAQDAITLKRQAGESYTDLEKQLVAIQKQMKGVGNAARQALEKDAANSAKALATQLENIERSATALSNVGQQISGVGLGLSLTGAGITGGIGLAAAQFVQNNPTDAAARDWLSTQAKLEESYTRMGRVASQTLLPVLKAGAQLAENLADLIEQNPELMKIALVGGAGLLGAGSLLQVVGTAATTTAALMQVTSSIGKALQGLGLATSGGGLLPSLTAAGGQAVAGAGAIGAGIGTGAAITATVAGGVGLGAAAYKGLATANNALGGDMNAKAVEQAFGILAYKSGELSDSFGFTKNASKDWFTSVGGLTGALDGATVAAIKTTRAQEQMAQFSSRGSQRRVEEMGISAPTRSLEVGRGRAITERMQNAFDAFVQYQDAQTTAQKQYESQRLALQKSMYAQLAEADKTYAQTRQQFITDFWHADAARLKAFQDGQVEAEHAYATETTRAQADFDDRRLRAAQDFAESEARTEADYYERRAQAAADFGEEMARAEADHQKEMARFAEDAADSMLDLAGQRDALGLVRARRQYEKDRQRKEQDYQEQIGQRNKEYAKRLAEDDAQFAKERGQRLDDYQQRLTDEQRQFDAEATQRRTDYDQRTADAQRQFDAETAQRQNDYQLRLAEMDVQHAKENQKRKDAKDQALIDLGERFKAEKDARDEDYQTRIKFILNEKAERDKLYAEMSADFDAFMESVRTGKAYVPSGEREPVRIIGAPRAMGGYADYGQYTLGEQGREFVLSAPATRAAESIVGARLNQQNITNTMLGGNNLNVNLGGINLAGDMDGLARRVGQEVEAKIASVLRRHAQTLKMSAA